MEKFKNRVGSRWIMMLSALLIVSGLTSCLKDGDNTPENVAAALFVNAVPGSEGLIVALDNNQVNNLQQNEWFEYGQMLRYRRVFPGERLLRLFHPNDVAANEEILRTTIEFDVAEYYSLFIVGDSDESMEVVRVADSLREVEAGTAMIRFINLSPDAPALDVQVEGRSSLLASGRAFKSHSDFITLDSGEEYTIRFRRTGSDEVVHEFELTPQSRYIYTICAKGFFNEADADEDTEFGHGIILH